MGELDLHSPATEEAAVGAGEGDEGCGDAFGDGLEDGVGQALLELAEAPTEGLGDSGGDAGVAEEKPLHVSLGHDADHHLVEGLGEAVMHLLTDDDHLTEDGPWFDDRGRQRPPVGGQPEDPDPALLEDEQGLQRVVRGVDEVAGFISLHGRCGCHRVHLAVVEVAEDVDLGHAPDAVVWGQCGPFDVHGVLSGAQGRPPPVRRSGCAAARHRDPCGSMVALP
jgi:hypothetical protein